MYNIIDVYIKSNIYYIYIYTYFIANSICYMCNTCISNKLCLWLHYHTLNNYDSKRGANDLYGTRFIWYWIHYS